MSEREEKRAEERRNIGYNRGEKGESRKKQRREEIEEIDRESREEGDEKRGEESE